MLICPALVIDYFHTNYETITYYILNQSFLLGNNS